MLVTVVLLSPLTHSNPLLPIDSPATHSLHLPDKSSQHQPRHLAQRPPCVSVSQIQSHMTLPSSPIRTSPCLRSQTQYMNPENQVETHTGGTPAHFPTLSHSTLICIPSGHIYLLLPKPLALWFLMALGFRWSGWVFTGRKGRETAGGGRRRWGCSPSSSPSCNSSFWEGRDSSQPC